MRIVVTENCTADGVISLSAGWFDPADPPDGQLVAATQAHMAQQDALLLGRHTFEAFRDYWPNRTDDTTGISDHLNRVHKYVLSTSLLEPGWEPATILRDLDEVRALGKRVGRLGVTGSISVAQQLAAADLVDEYRLFVFPVLVGSGAGVVGGARRVDLDLLEVTRFPSGVTLLRYERRRREGRAGTRANV